MRYTQNIKLPIVEDNDLYSKEINNLAFEKIDEEIQGLADIVETLDSPENSIADVKKDIKDIKSDVVDINEQLDSITSDISIVDNKVGINTNNILTNTNNIVTNTNNIVTNTNNINKITTQMNNMTNGIKGVYETLDLLKKAYPTGNTSLYVVSSDNCWYYWNGIEWTKGGIFQSLALGDNSINYNKLELCNTDVKVIFDGDVPNYDSSTKTLTFNSNGIILWGNIGGYECAKGLQVLNSQTSGSWHKLVFNTVDKTFRFEQHWAVISKTEIALFVMHSGGNTISGLMDITFDNSYPKPLTDIPNLIILRGGETSSSKGNDFIVIFDVLNKKAVFPSTYGSTTFYYSDGKRLQDSIPSIGLEVDISALIDGQISGNAGLLIWNRITNQFELIAYNSKILKGNYCYFATLKYTNKKLSVSCNVPYQIIESDGNNKPFGINKVYYQTLEYAKLQNGLLDKKPILDIKNKTLYFHKTLYDVGFIVYGQTISNVISKNGLLFKFNNSLSGTLKYLLLNTVTKEIVETNTLNGYYAPTYCILLSFTVTSGSDGYINKFVSDGAFEVEILGYTSQNNSPCNDTFINELNAPFRLISHRGWNTWSGDLYPEQTISAFKEAYKRGLRNIECDVKFTSDKIPVLLHDDTINRTARNLDGSELETDIYLKDLTFEQVRNNYDFGIYQGERFKGTKIPTLEEILRLCKILGMRLILEYKQDENGTVGVNEGVEKVYNLVKENGMLEYVVFLSGNKEVWNKIDELNTSNKSIELQYLDVPSDITNIPFVKSFKDKGYKVGFSVGREWINEDHANILKENEIDLYIWTREFTTFNDVETFEQWLNWNVKGITSNSTNIVNFAYNYLY